MQLDSLTNQAWKRLFDHFEISSHLESDGVVRLSANQIKQIGKREPRLMAKFDSREQRPKIFQKHDCTILPISNGEYVILAGDGYIDVPAPANIVQYDAGRIARYQTIRWERGIHSEPQAIDSLFVSSALRTYFGDDKLILTMRGRQRTRAFDFAFQTRIRKETIKVSGAQIEIDAGYEGEQVVVLEAKYGLVENFIVRQLYYPYRHLAEDIVQKPIRLALLVYSNRVYSIYEIRFPNIQQYQSAELARHAHFTLERLEQLPRFTDIEPRERRRAPTGIPFPQADDLSKVFDVTELLAHSAATKDEISEMFQVDPRQGDYYGNATAWLGLAEKVGSSFQLTEEGRRFAAFSRNARITFLARRISEMPVLREVIAATKREEILDINRIAELIARTNDLSDATSKRRALTVRAWVDWLRNVLPN